jgi:hypothetical protein
MPTKKISDRQRIITYASQCSQEQLSEAIETLQAINAGRFPREAKRAARARKGAAKQPTPAQPELTEISDEPPAKRTRTRQQDKFQPDPHMLAAIEENKRNRTVEADMLED